DGPALHESDPPDQVDPERTEVDDPALRRGGVPGALGEGRSGAVAAVDVVVDGRRLEERGLLRGDARLPPAVARVPAEGGEVGPVRLDHELVRVPVGRGAEA